MPGKTPFGFQEPFTLPRGERTPPSPSRGGADNARLPSGGTLRRKMVPPLEEIQRELAQRSLRHFVKYAWPILEPGTPLMHNWHIDAICEHYEALLAGEMTRLVVNIPPGFMKSMLAVMMNAWDWLKNPRRRYISATHTSKLTLRDSQRVRDIITSPWYKKTFDPQWELRTDTKAKGHFLNSAGGFRFSASVGGAITGHRGDVIIVDDPLDAGKTYSEAEREAAAHYVTRVLPSRLNDPKTSRMLLVMQRLHSEDPSGILLEHGWDSLILPMGYDPNVKPKNSIGWRDPRTDPGELLDKNRWTAEAVETQKHLLGPYDFAGQYQQTPVPSDGGVFKDDWWRFYNELPDLQQADEVISSWDLAFKGGHKNDYVVGQVWARFGVDLYLVDQTHARLGFNDTVSAILRQRAAYPEIRGTLIEDKANGPAVIESLKLRIPGVMPVQPKGGKEARAHAVVPLIAGGNVHLPNPAKKAWVADLLAEAASFPKGAHDDQVDALTQALGYLDTAATFYWTGLDTDDVEPEAAAREAGVRLETVAGTPIGVEDLFSFN